MLHVENGRPPFVFSMQTGIFHPLHSRHSLSGIYPPSVMPDICNRASILVLFRMDPRSPPAGMTKERDRSSLTTSGHHSQWVGFCLTHQGTPTYCAGIGSRRPLIPPSKFLRVNRSLAQERFAEFLCLMNQLIHGI